MDKNGRQSEAHGAAAMRELQQILPGIDRDAADVKSGRANPIVRKTRISRYEDLPDVLTPKEAQVFLRLGRNATYAALQNGKIRSIRHGQKFLIPKAALREFLDRDAEDPRAGIPVKGTT
jgi:excisionase family DNA binding protein